MLKKPCVSTNMDLVYKNLLESTLSVPWCLEWKTKIFTYIGPQIELFFGYKPSQWRTLDDWAKYVHKDDYERVLNFCLAQSEAGLDHETDYRILTEHNEYVWIRDIVRVICNAEGEIECLMGVMFDISIWKKQEQEAVKLKNQLEEYSYQDGLTGIANRRLFNQLFNRYWDEAILNQTDFTVLLIDIDYFKLYNDVYGHMQGDECLIQIAQMIKATFTRTSDVVARFGGEEFAVVLPHTNLQAAVHMAELLLANIQKLKILHVDSPISDYLSVSIGVKSGQITHLDVPEYFFNEVDQALYLAKQAGRNQLFYVV